MHFRSFLPALALAAAATNSYAVPIAASTFTTGMDGWGIVGVSHNAVWSPGDSKSAGPYVEATDPGGNGLWFFSAPTDFLGHKSAAFGGTLSYALKTAPDGFYIGGIAGTVMIQGAGGIIVAQSPRPGVTWQTFSFNMIADGTWFDQRVNGSVADEALIRAVLSNVWGIYIRGDYIAGGGDFSDLDTVVLTAGPATVAAVPEPSELALWSAGLIGLSALVRRRLER